MWKELTELAYKVTSTWRAKGIWKKSCNQRRFSKETEQPSNQQNFVYVFGGGICGRGTLMRVDYEAHSFVFFSPKDW